MALGRPQLLPQASSELTPRAELDKYFLVPGYNSAESAGMKGYELHQRGEFRRMPFTSFLHTLCSEFKRCQDVYVATLPRLFKAQDASSAGASDGARASLRAPPYFASCRPAVPCRPVCVGVPIGGTVPRDARRPL